MLDHPYRVFWATHDLEGWSRSLAPDIVLHSPMLDHPFRGRDTATELFGVLRESLVDFEITDEYRSGDRAVFFWEADVGGRRIEGIDRLLSNERGEVVEVTVYIRPLVSIAAFGQGVGVPLATKRGHFRGLLARVLMLPLRGMLVLGDAISTRLVQRREG